MIIQEDFEIYKKNPSLNYSTLKGDYLLELTLKKSAVILEESPTVEITTKAMFIGTLLHDFFLLKKAIPKKKKTTSISEMTVGELSMLRITDNDYYHMMKLVDKLQNHKKFMLLCNSYKNEVSCYTGGKSKPIKSRFDIMVEEKDVIYDLKFSSIVNKKDAFLMFGYIKQAGFYAYNYEQHFKRPLKKFVFVFIDRAHPYNIELFKVEGNKLKEQKELAKKKIDKYYEWIKTLKD